MVDPIGNAASPRELGLNQSRPPAVQTTPPEPRPDTNLQPDQRVEVMQAAVEKLIKKSLPSNSRLQILQDQDTGEYIYRSIDPSTGEVIRQWPPEQLLALREDLKTMEGLLVNKQV
jgi:flagellar protein FlaG